ncbi:ABC transporter substrate-binding protein [Pusillimonas caeni]|uniref:ABC transporter substrate-binding protein n=1 Tax=Pusillimonas caeni TaxID=1348472 RepID=UPI001FD7A912|nr:ABC transporter substrate-binding protein [Pusillimonas caeni]
MLAGLHAPMAPAANTDPIRIGLVLDLSGPFAEYGLQMQAGIKAFMKQRGDKVAGRPIELIVRDSTGPHPDVGKRVAQELLTREKVDILAGFGFSNVALAVAPMATQSKTPMIIMNAGASPITTASPYIVRTSFTLGQASDVMGRWAADNGIKKVMTIIADYAPGADAEEHFSRAYRAAGGEIVSGVRVPISNRDFAPYLQRVKNERPDAVFVFLPSGEPIIAFMKGYQERGLEADGIKAIAAFGADDGELPALGKSALGLISSQIYTPAHDSEKNRQFVKDFKEFDKHGLVPNFISVGAYDGMALIYAAVEKLNGDVSDGAKVVEAMKDWSHESPRGPISIDPETRDIIQNIYLRRVEEVDGKLVNVEFDKFENVKDPGKM